jgi:aspartate/methionine/tyrosine aminotransferase
VEAIAASKIREVANAGMALGGVVPLWFGEPDLVTPAFIREAAQKSLAEGHTFYGPNVGLPALREAIAAYSRRLGRQVQAEQVCVTASGVNALMLACQAIVEPGDRVVILTPHWPNLGEIPKVMGAQVEAVPLQLAHGAWTLNLEQLLSALTPDTRAVILNAPANPTGWTMTRAEQRAVLAHCRRPGIWIVADDVYERIVFDAPASPSFLDLAEPDDRIIGVNSFSKSWAMTGWRLGWLSLPLPLVDAVAKLVEFNISCTPAFVQHAGIAAIAGGEDFIASFVARLQHCRDVAARALSASPRLTVPVPQGAMYLFVQVQGCSDSLALAKALVQHEHVGLAPGIAFGPAGEGCLRICIANDADRLRDACERVVRYLAR